MQKSILRFFNNHWQTTEYRQTLPPMTKKTVVIDAAESVKLPEFQRRPLSDTPMATSVNSPTSSTNGTPLVSPENSALFLNQASARLRDIGEFDTITDETPTKTTNGFKHHNLVKERLNMTSSDRAPSRSRLSDELMNYNSDSGSVSPVPILKRTPTTLNVPGLTSSKISPDGLISKEEPGSKLIIVMVGLPATGKSFISNKLSRFLNYSLYYCKVFNVGNTRRRYARQFGIGEQDSNFFDSNNKEAHILRDKWAMDTLDEAMDYLLDGVGSVAIFDATNTTRVRRTMIMDKVKQRNDQLNVLFLESICTDNDVVENNIKLKLFGPDYKGKNPEDSLFDFKQRLLNYISAYEEVEDDEELQYIKMIDIGKKLVSYKIEGFLASQTVYYLLNFNLSYRQIWITRNGESENNVNGIIGGDSHLTIRGEKYAKALTKFMKEQQQKYVQKQYSDMVNENNMNKRINDFFIWTSMRQRAIETSQYFDDYENPTKQMRMLDEINAGIFEGLKFQEIEDKFPIEFEKRQNDKLRYRYPGIGGESYLDVINRLRTVITEIERIEDNLLIITHRVVARALLGYFMNLNFNAVTQLDIPLHCVYCLEPMPYGIKWTLYQYNESDDQFHIVPQTELNTSRVREMGLVYKERRYSIIPTTPSRSSSVSSSTRSVVHSNLDKEHGSSSSNSMDNNNINGKYNNEDLHNATDSMKMFSLDDETITSHRDNIDLEEDRSTSSLNKKQFLKPVSLLESQQQTQLSRHSNLPPANSKLMRENTD